MDARRFLIVFAVLAVALVAGPATAGANTVEFRGVVSGSPYGASNGYMAVPVLYSKQTARNVGLKSPVGLLVVKRTLQVKLPNGAPRILPANLRAGDRFKGKVAMKSAYTKSFYPRITFNAVTVYFRSKEISTAELAAEVDALRKAINDLSDQLALLRAGAIKAFQDLYAQLADLRNALAALKIPAGVDLTQIQSQLDALSKRVDDLIAGLPDFSQFALISQLPDLTQYLKLSDLTTTLNANTVITTLQDQVTTLQGQVTTLQTNLATVCNAVKAATVALPAPINSTVPVTINTGGVC